MSKLSEILFDRLTTDEAKRDFIAVFGPQAWAELSREAAAQEAAAAQGPKTLSRREFEALDQQARREHIKGGGTVVDG